MDPPNQRLEVGASATHYVMLATHTITNILHQRPGLLEIAPSGELPLYCGSVHVPNKKNYTAKLPPRICYLQGWKNLDTRSTADESVAGHESSDNTNHSSQCETKRSHVG